MEKQNESAESDEEEVTTHCLHLKKCSAAPTGGKWTESSTDQVT